MIGRNLHLCHLDLNSFCNEKHVRNESIEKVDYGEIVTAPVRSEKAIWPTLATKELSFLVSWPNKCCFGDAAANVVGADGCGDRWGSGQTWERRKKSASVEEFSGPDVKIRNWLRCKKMFLSHLLPKLRTYFYARLIDGVARIFS